MTTDSIKELVKRLRDGFITMECEDDVVRYTNHVAADALEAMAGEVERLKEERDAAITDRFDAAADRIKAVAAERDRLQLANARMEAALEAIRDAQLKRATAYPSNPDHKPSIYDLCEHRIMKKDTCEECFRDFARKALEAT